MKYVHAFTRYRAVKKTCSTDDKQKHHIDLHINHHITQTKIRLQQIR